MIAENKKSRKINIPKTPLAEYQKNLTPEQSSDLLKKMAWCNSCDALDIFCTKNDMGYCRECMKNLESEA